MTPYQAKFAREAKKNPTDWLIKPVRNGKVRLVYVGAPAPKQKDKCDE